MVKASGAAESVRVVVRCRPLNDVEIRDGRMNCVSMEPSRGEVVLRNPKDPSETEPRRFTFDKVFAEKTTQREIFEEVAKPQVEAVLQGFNCTIFAYGQTGTGKTYTMEGKGDRETRGVIPNTFEHLFASIDADKSGREYLVKVSSLELYNEEIRDLLGRDPTAKLELREEAGVVVVQGLSSFVVGCVEDMEKCLEVGRKNRVVGETSMNKGSSRSHCIFSITVASSHQDEKGNDHARVAKLNLVDLAGSERAGKTGAEGTRFKEGVNINLSLTALGNVISALVDQRPHIPYRDSKLTRLLQDSLGGNNKCSMFANIGPADWNYDETLSTLRYADRAKRIKNKPVVNEDPRDRTIREYQEEIRRLRELLAAHGQGGASLSAPSGRARGAPGSGDMFDGWTSCQKTWFNLCFCCCMPPVRQVAPTQEDALAKVLSLPRDPDHPDQEQSPAERQQRLNSLRSHVGRNSGRTRQGEEPQA